MLHRLREAHRRAGPTFFHFPLNSIDPTIELIEFVLFCFVLWRFSGGDGSW
jgi:hypothetical protein